MRAGRRGGARATAQVRHPQYVGAVMSVWGGLLLLHDGRHPEMLQLGLGWTACYVVSAIQEDFF